MITKICIGMVLLLSSPMKQASEPTKVMQNTPEKRIFAKWIAQLNRISSYAVNNYGKAKKNDFEDQFGPGTTWGSASPSDTELVYVCFQNEGDPDLVIPQHIVPCIILRFDQKTGTIRCIQLGPSNKIDN